MLKEHHSDSDLVDLVKEIEILKAIGNHPNIVNLIGVSTQPAGKPLWLITEYVENGNLKDFLIAHRPRPNNAVSNASYSGYERPISNALAGGIDLR